MSAGGCCCPLHVNHGKQKLWLKAAVGEAAAVLEISARSIDRSTGLPELDPCIDRSIDKE